jgi:hypothetical protein
MRSPPATTINAPIPVSARAVQPQVMGSFVPDAVTTKLPSISQTGNIIHGVRIITIPSRTSSAPIPFTIFSEVIVGKQFKKMVFIHYVDLQKLLHAHVFRRLFRCRHQTGFPSSLSPGIFFRTSKT